MGRFGATEQRRCSVLVPNAAQALVPGWTEWNSSVTTRPAAVAPLAWCTDGSEVPVGL